MSLLQLDSAACREMSVSDTEVSDLTWTDNGTFNLSEGHTPQTDNSDGLFNSTTGSYYKSHLPITQLWILMLTFLNCLKIIYFCQLSFCLFEYLVLFLTPNSEMFY